MRLRVSLIAVAVTAVLAGGAGVVTANSLFSPSTDVLHQGGSVGHFAPSSFDEGLSIGGFDFGFHSSEICHEDQDSSAEANMGITVRLADNVSQFIILNGDGTLPNASGDMCTRVGDAGTDAWDGWKFVRGQNP